MTKNTTKIRLLALLMVAFAGVGISYANASEVTGSLSSGTTGTSQTSGEEAGGSISGNVTGAEGSSSGSGSRSSGGGGRGAVTAQPTGAVLGEATSQAVSPTFPNAGFAPEGTSSSLSLVALIATTVTMLSLTFIVMKSWSTQ